MVLHRSAFRRSYTCAARRICYFVQIGRRKSEGIRCCMGQHSKACECQMNFNQLFLLLECTQTEIWQDAYGTTPPRCPHSPASNQHALYKSSSDPARPRSYPHPRSYPLVARVRPYPPTPSPKSYPHPCETDIQAGYSPDPLTMVPVNRERPR